jgi:hypothetical protein
VCLGGKDYLLPNDLSVFLGSVFPKQCGVPHGLECLLSVRICNGNAYKRNNPKSTVPFRSVACEDANASTCSVFSMRDALQVEERKWIAWKDSLPLDAQSGTCADRCDYLREYARKHQ